MMGQGILFVILLALTVAVIGVMLVQLVYSALETKKRALQQRLEAGHEEIGSVYAPLTMRDAEQELRGLLERFSFFKRLRLKLARAYPNVVLSRFLTLTATVAIGTFLAMYVILSSVLLALIGAALAGMVPFLVVNHRCSRHLRKVDDQLPEALDFLARILRAGHSLTTGFQMASEELPDPLASEFRQCYDQHSLGQPLDTCMRDMAGRVGTSDFAFFVTAVLIQRQTGGDLAEVLTNIGNMVRSRIRLQQHVKAITAQGRFVGYILLALPVIFFAIMYLVNRDYAEVLLITREGMIVLVIAIMLQVVGLLCIRKIVAVEM